MSDIAFGFILIAIIVLMGSVLLRHTMGRRTRNVSAMQEPDQKWIWCKDEVAMLVGLLEQQADTARDCVRLADAQGKDGHARFLVLIPEGNASQRSRLCEVFGSDALDATPLLPESDEVGSVEEGMEELLEQNAEMHRCCADLKRSLCKAKKIKAFQRIREFDDFLETREKVISDLQRGLIREGQTMKLCNICGSIFANDPPAVCLGCSAMNVEFKSFGPGDRAPA